MDGGLAIWFIPNDKHMFSGGWTDRQVVVDYEYAVMMNDRL